MNQTQTSKIISLQSTFADKIILKFPMIIQQ